MVFFSQNYIISTIFNQIHYYCPKNTIFGQKLYWFLILAKELWAKIYFNKSPQFWQWQLSVNSHISVNNGISVNVYIFNHSFSVTASVLDNSSVNYSFPFKDQFFSMTIVKLLLMTAFLSMTTFLLNSNDRISKMYLKKHWIKWTFFQNIP